MNYLTTTLGHFLLFLMYCISFIGIYKVIKPIIYQLKGKTHYKNDDAGDVKKISIFLIVGAFFYIAPRLLAYLPLAWVIISFFMVGILYAFMYLKDIITDIRIYFLDYYDDSDKQDVIDVRNENRSHIAFLILLFIVGIYSLYLHYTQTNLP